MSLTYATVMAAIEAHGVACRGGFHPEDADGVPSFAPGIPTGSVVLVGMVGTAQWRAFAESDEAHDGIDHPLDRWSRGRLTQLSVELGARALEPSDGPPFWPFQRWAQRAEPVAPSPLGLLIHPDYGLWHSYRGALLFAEHLTLPARDLRTSPCERCASRACLSTCPVGAFTPTGFEPSRCAQELRTRDDHDCLQNACAARRACPVGREHAQGSAQARFHLAAFLRSRPD